MQSRWSNDNRFLSKKHAKVVKIISYVMKIQVSGGKRQGLQQVHSRIQGEVCKVLYT